MNFELLIKLLRGKVTGPENFPSRGHQLARIHDALASGAQLWGTAHQDLLIWAAPRRGVKPTWESVFKVLANTLCYARRRTENY